MASTALSGRQVVGRDSDCDTVLAGSEISRRHAEFRADGPIVAVRDLGSRNGVLVNGKRCADRRLDAGDVVRCGEWIGVIVSGSLGPGAATDVARETAGFGEIAPGLFGSASLRAALAPVGRAGRDLPVVVEGETGTGKEDTARAVHAASGRVGKLVSVNCAALPEALAEAELFGYVKGAFTGADHGSPGLFREADGGTLFLDEVLELPLGLQAKLLRAAEEKRVRPVGAKEPVAVDARLVAAVQEPLATAVAEGRFRADLRARLEGLTVVLPPLRARREDVLPLFQCFWRRHAGGDPPALDPRFVEALAIYDWPLNVRELSHLALRLANLHGDAGPLTRTHLPAQMLGPPPALDAGTNADAGADGRAKRAWRRTDDEAEFASLVAALRNAGTVAKAAAAVGISRPRAYRLIAARPDFPLGGRRPPS